ncbi:hypothetical protein [Janthinobacterium sp. PC23-8]|uniref:hypothetical protein n=1 Tax=Janthinobacterium sp. PC23-8 TaxID=2012679 RepID=UPI0011401903|nr:hypothetical protein [Janthinobacterium sp. PC23-8]
MQKLKSVESRVTAMSMRAKAPLWQRIRMALENERCLDLQYRRMHTNLVSDAQVPNYKVMKQLALRNRFGALYGVFIALAVMLTPVLSCFEWVYSFLLLCRPRKRRPSQVAVHVIPTTPGNIFLVDAALKSVNTKGMDACDSDLMRLSRLVSEVGFAGVLRCVVAHTRLLWYALRLPAGQRRDMILHTRDAFRLIMLAHYAETHPEHTFATDDHYQRWAYLLSHSNSNLLIAQHGFLDPAIVFSHPFGEAACICVRDASFVPYFEKYYTARKFQIFSPPVSLTDNPLSGTAIFLASSFPSIQEEIDLITSIKKRVDVPIIIKFHPSHSYDEKKLVLSSMASYVCDTTEYPACKVFVSYGSFMEYDYRAMNTQVFSIVAQGGAAQTANAIVDFMGQT